MGRILLAGGGGSIVSHVRAAVADLTAFDPARFDAALGLAQDGG